ncbi:MAG: DUF362 domain-containing protein [bacterium]|nr:DUF362 domain-containing protein [bacterium]
MLFKEEIYLVEATQKDVDIVLSNLINKQIIRNKMIFIKPNVRSPHSPIQEKNTNPKTLDMVLSFLCNNFENKIIVGDSSIIGIDTIQSAKKSGLLHICKKYSVEFIDIKKQRFKSYPVPILPYMIEVTELLDNNCFIINIPKLKTAYATPLSLSIKNLKGLLSDKSKEDFHRFGIDFLLPELYKIVKSDLTIIDGLGSLSLDTPISSNLLLVSKLSAQLDAYVSEKVGIDLKDIGYLKKILGNECYSRNTTIKTIGCPSKLEELKMEIVKIEDFLHYPNIKIIGRPCYNCYGSIYKAIKKIGQNKNILIFCGIFTKNDLKDTEKELNNVKKGKYQIVLNIGNCSLKILRGAGEEIQGCPPTILNIKNKLEATNFK